ncbi:hypothetical protein CTEN210_02182 [Chaetoceros tenuissimus]|uniref:Nudix hydrolase domain-containing protein n=1 Tax=Chaetoceros tenuissimus TaxID=426638 RepID=A0AAD3H0M2_9STRA|nr:hypothetical protein CTEN210_02182 [Chaetoceros tenuissimus]
METTEKTLKQKNSTTKRWNNEGSQRTRRKRGGSKRSSHQSFNTKKQGIRVFTENFEDFVKACDGAKRYKVHKRDCRCPKISNIIQQLQKEDPTDQQQEPSFAKKMKLVKERFLVLPDSKGLKAIFASSEVLAEDPRIFHQKKLSPKQRDIILKEETRLKELIFPSNENPQKVKVSCAACLLEVQQNGFLAIASSDFRNMKRVTKLAIEARELKLQEEKDLHHDHADYVCILPRILLQKHISPSKQKGRISNRDLESFQELKQCMNEQNINITDEDRIEFGHHLETMLGIFSGIDANFEQYKYLFVMINKDVKGDGKYQRNVYVIDLPGGKRHMGEYTFDCAVRETEEETSLLVDEKWLVNRPVSGTKPLTRERWGY